MNPSRQVLQAVVDHFNRRFAPNKRREQEMIRSLPNLAAAIEMAGQARKPDGRREPHQRRRQRQTLDECTRILLAHEADIARSKDFEDVYAWVDKLLHEVLDVGALYTYDIATTIATWMGFAPQQVYLHAGTADGAACFGIARKVKRIKPAELPAPLSGVPADDLEDILCIYKSHFQRNRMPESDEIEQIPCILPGATVGTPPVP